MTLYSEYFQQQNVLRGHFHQCIMDIYVLSHMLSVLTHHLAFVVTKVVQRLCVLL